MTRDTRDGKTQERVWRRPQGFHVARQVRAKVMTNHYLTIAEDAFSNSVNDRFWHRLCKNP